MHTVQRTQAHRKTSASVEIRQTQVDRIVEQQQQTALILERVAGRLDALERWQEASERAKEREEERRDERQDKQPDQLRANIAIAISASGAILYAIGFIVQHWKP